MLKIIIPLAGSSEMFTNSGYVYPKPLIEVNELPMIQLVVDNAASIPNPKQFVFIISNEDALKYHLDNTLKLISPESEIIKLKKGTKGALCSVLMTIDKIDNDDSLMILNGDQIIETNYEDILNFWKENNADAGIVTFKSVHPRWSYARVEDGKVTQTAEKNPISENAIAGCYYFKKASEFFEAAFKTISNDVQLDGSYYISPVLNEYVLKNQEVKNYKIAPENYHSFYSPQMLKKFTSR